MNNIKKILLILLFVIIFPVSEKAANVVNLYLFYGDGYPHCAEEEKFIEEY
jgi:hypothetical protein